jgi:hypothetical protein
MRRVYTPERARFLLAEADAMIARGAIQADVCRELRVSHVVYKRLRRVYGSGRGEGGPAGWEWSMGTPSAQLGS